MIKQAIESTEISGGLSNVRITVDELRRDIERYLLSSGRERFCKVKITRDGHWFELAGHVDSHWTRAALFTFIPKTRGARHVVDKLRVVDPIQQKEELL